ncbi:hypothetical protein DOY81_012410 [Sarcophaga bullata]|nr:hypothetical protein DOY81_012410 [Sarcophaga bullata]
MYLPAEDDDEDEDDDDDDDDDDSDDTDSETDDTVDKKKIFLTDRKFRNNRIEKSSSKSKIAGDLEKRESIKRSRSNRKIPTASALLAAAEEKQKQKQQSQQQKKLKSDNKDSKKPNRPHSNLNLHALVKFVMNNKKFLNTDDFNLIRRKSISEAASAVIQVAATCKPMPIALKYPQDSFVADAPKDNDPKAEVMSFWLRNKVSIMPSVIVYSTIIPHSLKPPVKERKKSPKSSVSSISSVANNNKVKRNSSNSSKSSGNYEDEAFYSCDEREEDELDCAPTMQRTQGEIITSAESKRKSSSPSLTSRVAAKINETTNNYKNRKAANKNAKKRKNLAASAVAGVVECTEGPEYYKQLNVERLNSTSIQRHPSDRRTDSANLSIRSNGNSSAHLNASDLQSSFHGADTSLGAVGGSSGSSAQAGLSGSLIGNNLTTSCSDTINPTMGALSAVSQQTIGAVSPGGSGALAGTLNDINAQDANEGNLRRERLHQQHQQNKSAPVSVNRSESYKERLSHKRNRSQRKTSDPNLTSRPK